MPRVLPPKLTPDDMLARAESLDTQMSTAAGDHLRHFAEQMIARYEVLGLRRQWFLAQCPHDSDIFLVTTGPKGPSGLSTWKGSCATCGARADRDPRPTLMERIDE